MAKSKLELDELTEKRLDESLVETLKDLQEKRELAAFIGEMSGGGKVSRCNLARIKGMEDLLFFLSRLVHAQAMDVMGEVPSLKETPFGLSVTQLTFVLAYLGDKRSRATLAEALDLKPRATVSPIKSKEV